MNHIDCRVTAIHENLYTLDTPDGPLERVGWAIECQPLPRPSQEAAERFQMDGFVFRTFSPEVARNYRVGEQVTVPLPIASVGFNPPPPAKRILLANH